MTAGHKWRPLKRVTELHPPTRALIEATATHYKVTDEDAINILAADKKNCEYWTNDLYQVEVRRVSSIMVHLNIRRRDGALDIRDWRHFQRIKNEIVGEECEAIELYPAESRLVDASNKFHLWAVVDPTFRFPFGFNERQVVEEHVKGDTPGLRQRGRS